jgi:hypothetical protein
MSVRAVVGELDTPIFQRNAYQFSIRSASLRDLTGRSVISFQSIRSRPSGDIRSLGVDHGQSQFRIMLVLANGRKNLNAFPFEFQRGFGQLTVPVSDFDTVQPFGGCSLHFGGDGVTPISGKPIHTSSHEKASSDFLRSTEKFVDITLPISNVHTAPRFA